MRLTEGSGRSLMAAFSSLEKVLLTLLEPGMAPRARVILQRVRTRTKRAQTQVRTVVSPLVLVRVQVQILMQMTATRSLQRR